MNRFFKFYLPVIIAFALISSCGNKYGEPVEIDSLTEYKDDATEFVIKYPSNWVTSKISGKRFAVFASNEGMSRFSKYDGVGFPGAKIDLNVIKMDSLMTLDSIIANNKLFSPELYKQEDITLDGVPAKKFTYSFDLDDGAFHGEMYVATKDNEMATVLFIESFGNTWEKYQGKFNEIVSSLKLATAPKPLDPTIINVEVEEPAASENLSSKSGPGYNIMIPDNFNSTKGTGRNVISSQNYIGKRRADCNIQVDVIDASKSKDLSKIAQENKDVYSGSGAVQNTRLGGVDAKMFSYRPTGQVKGKIYFAIKGDKLYRITMNWFTGEEASYLPIFEKSVNSIKFD